MNRRLAHEYLDALKHQRRLSAHTLRNYGAALDLLPSLIKDKPLEKFEPADIRRGIALLHAKGLAPRTLALVLSAWRGWFAWLVRHRGLKTNPALGVRGGELRDRVSPFATPTEAIAGRTVPPLVDTHVYPEPTLAEERVERQRRPEALGALGGEQRQLLLFVAVPAAWVDHLMPRRRVVQPAGADLVRRLCAAGGDCRLVA